MKLTHTQQASAVATQTRSTFHQQAAASVFSVPLFHVEQCLGDNASERIAKRCQCSTWNKTLKCARPPESLADAPTLVFHRLKLFHVKHLASQTHPLLNFPLTGGPWSESSRLPIKRAG